MKEKKIFSDFSFVPESFYLTFSPQALQNYFLILSVFFFALTHLFNVNCVGSLE